MPPAEPAPTLTLPPAETPLGERFRKLRPYARGGLGEVFVARDEQLSREVALKQMLPRYTAHAASRERFVREAEITGGLEHPGIVPVYGLGTCRDGRPYYAMRFIRGETLKDAIVRFHEADPPLAPGERSVELRRLLARMVSVCQAVEYAHSRGVLHRDLKPGNIMLGKYGETLVVDWGLAKAAGREDVPLSGDVPEPALVPSSGSSEATAMGKAIGTPSYMSPEQAAGRLDLVSAASDVYSLGATLYEVLTGRPPIVGGSVAEMIARVQKGKILQPRKVQPDVPAGLEAICLKALAFQPRDRYASAAALAQDLEHWLADEPITAKSDTRRERLDRWLRRNQTLAAAGAVTVVLVAIAASISLAIVHSARLEAVAAHAKEELAHEEATRERNLAHAAVNRYEDVVAKLQHLAEHPELAMLRESPEYQELIEHHAHTQATIADTPLANDDADQQSQVTKDK
jgi:serine/threonine protein kinase